MYHVLYDQQWLVLELLMRARRRRQLVIDRRDLFDSAEIHHTQAARLVFAAQHMPKALIRWTGENTFTLTDEGVAFCRKTFAKPVRRKIEQQKRLSAPIAK